jgi:hypothetical protein
MSEEQYIFYIKTNRSGFAVRIPSERKYPVTLVKVSLPDHAYRAGNSILLRKLALTEARAVAKAAGCRLVRPDLVAITLERSE